LSIKRLRGAPFRDNLALPIKRNKVGVMADLFEQGCSHFDAGEYFEAHEVWEELWNEAHGPRHAFLQGLIQIAVALHHAGNGNFKGPHKLFARALAYLEKGASDSKPIDLEKLKDCVLDFELAIQAVEAGKDQPLPYFKLPYSAE